MNHTLPRFQERDYPEIPEGHAFSFEVNEIPLQDDGGVYSSLTDFRVDAVTDGEGGFSIEGILIGTFPLGHHGKLWRALDDRLPLAKAILDAVKEYYATPSGQTTLYDEWQEQCE